MPPALLRAYDDQLPVLQAREQLALATAVALGSATLRKGAADQLWTQLRRQGQLRRPARRVHVRDLASVGKAMGMVGMGVRVHQRPPGAPAAPGGAPGTPQGPRARRSPHSPTSGGP